VISVHLITTNPACRYQLMLKCWSMDAEDRPTFSKCVTYLEAYLADRAFTLPSNNGEQVSFSNGEGQAENLDEGGYLLPSQGSDEHMMSNGYLHPTGDVCERSDNRYRSESRSYQNLDGAANVNNYYNNIEIMRDPVGRRLNVYEQALRASGVHQEDCQMYQPLIAYGSEDDEGTRQTTTV
jgi:hypothetical protein